MYNVGYLRCQTNSYACHSAEQCSVCTQQHHNLTSTDKRQASDKEISKEMSPPSRHDTLGGCWVNVGQRR